MKTIRTIYHWGMAIAPFLGLAYLAGNTVRMIAGEYNAAYILWNMAMAYVAYHFMVLPALSELRKFRKEGKR